MPNAQRPTHDLIIIGGGLAGLSLAILMRQQGRSVLVLEKGTYPRHKVCGEFVSRESGPFLKRLGMPLDTGTYPDINTFQLSLKNGHSIACQLAPGGWGISRYTLDAELAKRAEENGATVLTHEKATLNPDTSGTALKVVSTHSGQSYTAPVVVGAQGRRVASKQKRPAFFGVKYHVEADIPVNTIRIHTFSGGYAGISRVEGGKSCFCYMASAKHLRQYRGNISEVEKHILSQNPALRAHIQHNKVLEGPFSTANLHFGMHDQTHKQTLLCGDAAAFIPPLTGNGMSLAFRSAAVLAKHLQAFYAGTINEAELLARHRQFGERYLAGRIQKGRFLQNLILRNNSTTDRMLYLALRYIPGLFPRLAKQASGKPF